jgi:hypothetical protein
MFQRSILLPSAVSQNKPSELQAELFALLSLLLDPEDRDSIFIQNLPGVKVAGS